MKLSEFPQSLWKQISREEIDLEREVLNAKVSIQLEVNNKEIYIHSWDYGKEVK